MASSQFQTYVTPEYLDTWHEPGRGKRFTLRIRILDRALKEEWETALELLKSCLHNIWIYLGALTLFLPIDAVQQYRISLMLVLVLIGVSLGALSLVRELRRVIARVSAPLVYDIAVREGVRKILWKFNAKEKAVLRALTICEPWNRWKHLPDVEVPLHEQFEILYKALQEHLLIQVDQEDSVRFVPQYLEHVKAMLFEPACETVTPIVRGRAS